MALLSLQKYLEVLAAQKTSRGGISLAVKMLSRSTFLLPLCGPQQQQQQRAMSTLKAISMRLRSVKNIQKITKSMKMVSAAKYARAERELKPARAYGIGAKTFYEAAEIGAEEPAPDASQLLVAVTSDRGLCGAVHSSIAKRIRANYTPEGNYKIVCIGDKSRTILQRTHNQNILFHVSEVGKKAPSFSDATAVAQEILASGYEFNTGNIFFNIFRSVVSYDTSELPLYSLDVGVSVVSYDTSELPLYSLDVGVSVVSYDTSELPLYSLDVGVSVVSYDTSELPLYSLDVGVSVVSYDTSELPLYSLDVVVSVVSYDTSELPLYSLDAVTKSPNLAVYDSLDAEVTQSYLEFSLASMLYYAMKEGACSEQSSRMTAMDNASKNAGEMIDKLTLTFNRTRQAVITRELIEIISGAAALK
ncbi:ATP synthase subunit gamma, mitochondrial [Amphibalanus amphitrite]|uniref:F-ATPase gamma subunit n=1 Tax=Amphibalanus amphitrite TaxID=1232801 RepID=A0A6A4V063_AMPAM|nr:ATP synthase subunit gamma, mitochondrial [Amphibalanus amphitrite]